MIGIFDTGVGGLTVVKQIFRYLPGNEIVYLGDSGRFPYTTKPLKIKIAFSLQDAALLVEQGAEILLIACNTITAFAGHEIRKEFSFPVFDIVSAGAYGASRATKNNRVGVIGSRDTINSNIYDISLKKINPDIQVFQQATQLLIYLVEEDYINYPETCNIVKNLLKLIKKHDIDTLILGCTHFPFLKKDIREAMEGKVALVDPAIELARQVKTYLDDNVEVKKRMKLGKDHRFFISGDLDNFRKSVKKFLHIEIKNIYPLIWDKKED
jgi:glutamate racemase